MTELLRKHGFTIIVVVLVLAFAVYFAMGYLKKDERFANRIDAPPFELTNTAGETVSLENTNGKVRLLYFFFSHCPDVCPPTTDFMSDIQDELKKAGVFGSKALLLSATFDPERDTPERLVEFAEQFDADFSGWHFLRGEKEYVREVADNYGIAVMDDPDREGNIIHINAYILLDKEGKIANRYLIGNNLSDFDPEKIADDIVYLTKE